jgi:hypothetical protein
MSIRRQLMRRMGEWLARALVALLVALAALGPAAPAGAAQWVENFVPTELWSGPNADAVSFGTAPQWDYFQVISQTGTRLLVQVARTGNYAFVDLASVGPSGPPPAGWPNAAPAAAPAAPPGPAPAPAAPPVAQPAAAQSAVQPAALPPGGPGQAVLAPIAGYTIMADRALWPALQVLQALQHSWTLQALTNTGTRIEWALMMPEAAGAYQPSRSLIVVNVRWYRSDPRALAATIEHEAKHVADLASGMDVDSPGGCVATEVNAFREEAKTWGELVGPAGKPGPRDELETSLNFKLSFLQQSPDAIQNLIVQNPGYRGQCHIQS